MIYHHGDLFRMIGSPFDTDIFMLTQVAQGKWCLVRIDGGRWCNPVMLRNARLVSGVEIPDDSNLWGGKEYTKRFILLKGKRLEVVGDFDPVPKKDYRRIVL